MYMLYLVAIISTSIGIGLFAGVDQNRKVMAETAEMRVETAFAGRDRMLRALRREILMNPGYVQSITNRTEIIIPPALVTRARANTGVEDFGMFTFVLRSSGEVAARMTQGVTATAKRFGDEYSIVQHQITQSQSEIHIGVLNLASLGIRIN